jgi:hypothetical protein
VVGYYRLYRDKEVVTCLEERLSEMLHLCERKRYILSHPVQLKPEDLLSFIHHPTFTNDWKDLGLDDDDLAELELCLMVQPKGEALVGGDDGAVRLIAVESEIRADRRSVSVVVGYALFEHRSIVALLAAEFWDGENLGITDDDRDRLRDLVDEIGRGL